MRLAFFLPAALAWEESHKAFSSLTPASATSLITSHNATVSLVTPSLPDYSAWVCPQIKAGGDLCKAEGAAKAVAVFKSSNNIFNGYDGFMNSLHAVQGAQRNSTRKLQLFDIGCAEGRFSTDLASLFGDKAAIHCFEPTPAKANPQLLAKLTALQQSQPSVKVIAIGMSNVTGELGFCIHDLQEHNGICSADKAAERDKGNGVAGFRERVTVPIETVDSYMAKNKIESVDFLKIDVEGLEPEVLEGAKQSMLAKKVAVVQFEYGGTWGDDPRSLRNTTLQHWVTQLGQWGYEVFYAGDKALLKLDGACWDAGYESHQWSNMIAIQKDHPQRKALLLAANGCPA